MEKVEYKVKGMGFKPKQLSIPQLKNGSYSTDSEHLAKIDCDYARKLVEYRELEKDAGTNFQTWSDFVTYFNTYGITSTSKVTVITDEVTTGTASLTLTQNSTKPTSSTVRLIIDGNNKKLSNAATYEVLGLNGIDYLTIRNLTVENSNTSYYQSCIRMYGGADYNSVQSCTLQLSALSTGITSGGAYFAFASTASSLTSTSTTHNGSYDTINNCSMRTTNSNSPGPTYAIVDQQGSSYYSSTPSNNTFSNNTIQNFYYYLS